MLPACTGYCATCCLPGLRLRSECLPSPAGSMYRGDGNTARGTAGGRTTDHPRQIVFVDLDRGVALADSFRGNGCDSARATSAEAMTDGAAVPVKGASLLGRLPNVFLMPDGAVCLGNKSGSCPSQGLPAKAWEADSEAAAPRAAHREAGACENSRSARDQASTDAGQECTAAVSAAPGVFINPCSGSPFDRSTPPVLAEAVRGDVAAVGTPAAPPAATSAPVPAEGEEGLGPASAGRDESVLAREREQRGLGANVRSPSHGEHAERGQHLYFYHVTVDVGKLA
jgi:hypothetical protein